ncbi:MAG: Iron-regulated transporter rane component SufB, partial [Pseudonocardia sp.]|nr:Iron-regulated transporter rane component SufB [Pseudonocardia sp.]
MTTAPETLTQEETLATLGRYDFGWADPDAAGATDDKDAAEGYLNGASAGSGPYVLKSLDVASQAVL